MESCQNKLRTGHHYHSFVLRIEFRMSRCQISHAFVCPITQQVMIDPVLCADGVTYERSAITLWMQTQNVSPVTEQPFFHRDLTPNDRLRLAIQAFQQVQREPSPPPRSALPPVQPIPYGWQSIPNGGRPAFVNTGTGEISHEQPIPPPAISPGSSEPFMSRQGTASFKSRAPAHYNAIWEWENDAGTGYNSFDPSVVAVLEPQFLRHARERSEASANFTYERPTGGTWVFNFDFMMQTNPDTNGSRAIRRR
jgi:hypothetical protein